MGGVVVAPVKGQPNRGVAPIAKAVGEKGATICFFNELERAFACQKEGCLLEVIPSIQLFQQHA